MKYWLVIALLFLIGGIGTFFTVLYRTPNFIMRVAEHRMAQAAGGYNSILHGHRPTAASRGVVRPSPDQLYSLCVFNLDAGPVAFTGRVPEVYFSLSFYADNTDSFFVVDDQQLDTDRYRFVLIGKNAKAPNGVSASHVIRSPSQTGIALTRMFIPSARKLDKLQAVHKSSVCQPFSRDL